MSFVETTPPTRDTAYTPSPNYTDKLGRGPKNDHIVVRLADEGVPTAAIARVYRRPIDEIAEILKAAVRDGHINALPAGDWPPGTRRETRTPCLPPMSRVDTEVLMGRLQIEFGLTTTEARALAALMRRPEMTKGSLHVALSRSDTPVTEPKIVDVVICKMRKKLKQHDIEIKTVWGRGYTLPRIAADAVWQRLRNSGWDVTPEDLPEVRAA